MKGVKEKIETIKGWWRVAPPKTKRTVLLSVLFVCMGFALVVSSIISGPKKKKTKPKPPEIEIISKSARQEISESASVRRLRQKVYSLSSDVERVKKDLNELKKNITNLDESLKNYQEHFKIYQDQLVQKIGELTEIAEKSKKERNKRKESLKKKKERKAPSFTDIWGKTPSVAPFPPQKPSMKKWQSSSSSHKGSEKGLIGEIKETSQKSNQEEKKSKEIVIRIPAGSFFRGILLNGVDAPVSMIAKRQPYPVLIKVKTEAWLPNEYRYDIKGCYIVAAAWGDMSSERAYFRTERFSCIKKDGGVIETKIDGSVTDGQDGKLGVFGKLVSKQGQIIARTILAEMISGFGNALSPKQGVPVFNLGESSESDYYTNPPLGKGLRYGFFTGMGEAMKKVADFYLKMAEQVFPTIEVQAGIPVEIFLLRGLTLTLKKKIEDGGINAG